MDASAAALASSSSSFYSRHCRDPFPRLVRRNIQSYKSYHRLSCISKESDGHSDCNNDNRHRPRQLRTEEAFRLLRLSSATLTVISSSLVTLESATAAAAVQGAVDNNRGGKKYDTAALSPEQFKAWSGGLPSVTHRIPYTDVLHLKEQEKVKHIIKLSSLRLKQHSSVAILVVLDDSRVLRTVLPAMQRDERFWKTWDRLGMDALCINAYTPPLKKTQFPYPYLRFLVEAPSFLLLSLASSLLSFLPSRIEEKTKSKPSKRMLNLEKARNELVYRRKAELAKAKKEKELMEKALKAQKRKEEKERRDESRKLRKAQHKMSVSSSKTKFQHSGTVWQNLAENKDVATAMGFVIFFLFYRVVVLNYRKQQKDYEDRLKIEEAEREEKRKMRQLENELAGIEGGSEDEDEGKGEQNPYLKMAMKFMQSGARLRRPGGLKLPQYLEKDNEVKFADVAGLGNIRLELEEVVKFFTHGEMYRRRGVKIPGGILLCGPPGVGKTLLAKAVAGEAGVNFFSISASQFVEIYIGVGASRVRALYEEAKENAPSVVFIDELDAVGRVRGLVRGSGGQERDATLNQLLVCLDGFEGRGNVITIAATNRPDILDPALVRPGRFDRKIFIPRPGLIGRAEILQVHAHKKPMTKDVDYMAVASATDGMVGAELANIIEIAALSIMRDGRSGITTDDLLQAVQIEERGLLDKKERSFNMWKQLAVNEAAMAVAAVNFPDLKSVEFLTISPRAGRDLGYVRLKLDHTKFTGGLLSRQSLLDYITMQLAPRAADEIWYGSDQLSTICAETADNARSAARSLVLGGLSEKYYGLSDFWVSDRLEAIDLDALRILNMCYDRAKEILQRNRILMDAVVERLIQEKSISKHDFFQLIEEHGLLEPPKLSIADIRANKRAEFQELVMNRKETITGHSV